MKPTKSKPKEGTVCKVYGPGKIAIERDKEPGEDSPNRPRPK